MEDVRAGVRTWVRKSALGMLGVFVALFWSAGTLRWREGWTYFGLYLAGQLATGLVLIPRRPELIAERSKLRPGTKRWDKAVLAIGVGLGPLLTWIVAGLDHRYGWTGPLPRGLYAAAVAAALAGNALIIWAMDSNPFFSATVRIQPGQTVASQGPYRAVRHPGYAGWLLFFVFHPVLLGSWWSAIPVAVAAAVLLLRTVFEDRTLHRELPGYAEYAGHVRWRLLPGLW